MRIEEGDNWKLYLADCMDVLPDLEGVDAWFLDNVLLEAVR